MFCNIKYQVNQIENKELFQSEKKCLDGKLSQILLFSTQFQKDSLEHFLVESYSISRFYSE